jgi:murein DD-endopeptidase MepM/ murein hydrolase activator NlpD
VALPPTAGSRLKVLRRFLLLFVCTAAAAAGFWIHGRGLDGLAELSRFVYATPHSRYAAHIRGSSIPNAQRWLDAADSALQRPQTLRLPSRLKVASTSEPLARGYAVSLRRGQRYVVEVAADRSDEVFIDVFRKLEDEFQPLANAGQGESAVTVEIPSDGEYIVRVQPTLEARSGLALTFHSEPALALPVRGAQPASIQSFFGAVRDGGRRSHHGVDIFAQRGTAVTAAAGGFVTTVGTNALGGNVVWIARIGHGERHYYAHLDQQLVSVGRWVRRGDVIGTVGNTGNARTTAPHLHFGIYGKRGPVDPLPYIRRTESIANRRQLVSKMPISAP